MSTILAPPSTFFESLKWVRCIFCLKQFSQTQQFLVFACNAVACADCAKKMFSREDNKMMCNHCKKKVSYLVIREEMPENVRKMFESPLKMGQEIVNTHSYQQRHRAMIQDRLRTKLDGMKQMINERAHEIQQNNRATEQSRNRMNMQRQEILKLISEDRLKHLMALDVEQLRNMSYAQLKGAPPRRRDSRIFNVAPMHSANTSSTPTTFRSHASNASRSSSAAEQRWNFNQMGNAVPPMPPSNKQPPRRRSSHRSTIMDCDAPPRIRRESVHRRQTYGSDPECQQYSYNDALPHQQRHSHDY